MFWRPRAGSLASSVGEGTGDVAEYCADVDGNVRHDSARCDGNEPGHKRGHRKGGHLKSAVDAVDGPWLRQVHLR